MPDDRAADVVTLADVLLELRALRTELRQAQRRPAAKGDDELEALLAAIHAAIAGKVFSLVDVAHLAAVDDVALAEAMRPWKSLRSLGRALARAAGRPIGNYRIECVGRDRDGSIWRVTRLCADEVTKVALPLARAPRARHAGGKSTTATENKHAQD